MIRFSTTGKAFAEVLEAAEGVAVAVCEAPEGVAVPAAGAVAARVVSACGRPPDPQALSTSRQLTANTTLMTGFMASSI
jgi:hypothetical protein